MTPAEIALGYKNLRERIARETGRMAAVTLTGTAGTVVMSTEPTDAQRAQLFRLQGAHATPDHLAAPALSRENTPPEAPGGRGHTTLITRNRQKPFAP